MKIVKVVDAFESWGIPSEIDFDSVEHIENSEYTHLDVIKKLPITNRVLIDRLDTPDITLKKFRIPVSTSIHDDIVNYMNKLACGMKLVIYAGKRLPTYQTIESGESMFTWYFSWEDK